MTTFLLLLLLLERITDTTPSNLLANIDIIEHKLCLSDNFLKAYQMVHSMPMMGLTLLQYSLILERRFPSKLYTPSTLNIDRILWHTELIVCAVIVFCCIVAWIQPESSLTFLVVNKIFLLSEDEISWEHFWVYSRKTIFEIVQEKNLKCSKLIHF